jgi:nitronate monooxygenase
MKLPVLIQGGMGAAISSWKLAQAVSRLGQLGVVSGTALDGVLVRRLQDGDLQGHIRRALQHFPFPEMAQRVFKDYFIPGGKAPDAPYRPTPMHTLEGHRKAQETCIVGNFVEVFLAREGHSNPVGINYLEKIQFPHLPSLYGAMLAGVAVVIVGAGIPLDFPAAIAALATHQPATYRAYVTPAERGAPAQPPFPMVLDPAFFREAATLTALTEPAFLPIVSSLTLATMLNRKAGDAIAGFVIEGPTAGGHNAPPRGLLQLTDDGQPIYGKRDEMDLEGLKALGKPFWLAGGYGTREGLRAALALGAVGIQTGTPFALCSDSGMADDLRHACIRSALQGRLRIVTDPRASPTGFPFKVAQLEGTLSDPAVYAARRRLCDLGYLREAYRKPDDSGFGYRCAAEPEAAYVAKGGDPADTAGRKCLCNALIANVGMPQRTRDGGVEKPLITLGDAVPDIRHFCSPERPDFNAADVIAAILPA